MSFLSRLFKSRIKHVTVSICGLDSAGKTTLVNYLMQGEFTDTQPTLGVNRKVIDLPKLNINILDLGGQEDFRGLWSDINERTDGIIYIVDSTDFVRHDEAKQIFFNIINTQIRDEIPILILLNKIDLANHMTISEFIDKFSLSGLNSTWKCYETSALTGQGVYQSFKWLIEKLGDDA